jgi:hypothetical protein
MQTYCGTVALIVKAIFLNMFSIMEEVVWESMSTRRQTHKLTLYYKIVNNCSPSYLSDLLPFQVCQRTQHK